MTIQAKRNENRTMDPTHSISNDTLLKRIADQRDSQAFAMLFQRFKKSSFNLAARLTGDMALAEDVVQESMLNIWKSAKTYKPGHARSWILRIVARQSLKAIEKRKHRREDINQPLESTFAVMGENNTFQDNEEWSALNSELAHLPTKQQQILALYYGSRISHREIGTALKMPTRTVCNHIEQALSTLRSRLSRGRFASALLILEEGRVNELLCSGLELPKSLDVKDIGEILNTHSSYGAESLIAKKGAGLSIFTAAGLVLTLSGIGYLSVSNQLFPRNSQSDSSATSTAFRPTEEQTNLTTPKPFTPVNKTWRFSDGPKEGFKAICESWEWKPRARTDLGKFISGMVVGNNYTAIELPIEVGEKPFAVTIDCAYRTLKQDSCAEGWWFMNPTVADSEMLICLKLRPNPPHVNITYFVDHYSATITNGPLLGTLRRFKKPFPSRKVIVLCRNAIIRSITVKHLEESEIPKMIRDLPRLFERTKNDPKYQYVPLTNWEATGSLKLFEPFDTQQR